MLKLAPVIAVSLVCVAAWSLDRRAAGVAEPPAVAPQAVERVARPPTRPAARSRADADRDAEAAPAAAEDESSPGAVWSSDAQVDMPAAIGEAIVRELAPLRGTRQVERYLAALEARAREQGRVTALEVEPGIAALRQLEQERGEPFVQRALHDFSTRMRRLSHELEGTGDAPQPIGASELAELETRIDQSSPGAERAALVQRFRLRAALLDPDARTAAMQRLQRSLTAAAR